MTQHSEPISFATLLQERPPGTESNIFATETRERMDSVQIPAPGLFLVCPTCEHKQRYFHPQGRSDSIVVKDEDKEEDFGEGNKPSYALLYYSCEQCDSLKIILVEVQRSGGHLRALKIGEHPPYQPPRTDRSLSNFLGSSRQLYFHGLACENRNLGIGAFTYYRRVVEAQKEKLFESLIKVARKLDVDAAKLEVLEKASAEPQFTKALDAAKDAIPKRLFIDNTNPFIVLYRALSVGIHEGSDGECIKKARAIRLVLTRLVELINEVTADESEVRAAMAELARPQN